MFQIIPYKKRCLAVHYKITYSILVVIFPSLYSSVSWRCSSTASTRRLEHSDTLSHTILFFKPQFCVLCYLEYHQTNESILNELSTEQELMAEVTLLKYFGHVLRGSAGTAPVYLADKCTLVIAAGRHPLWSADNRTCLVKRSHNQFGDCCFATAGPMLWNSLPEQLRQLDISFGQFKRSLKTFMFG